MLQLFLKNILKNISIYKILRTEYIQYVKKTYITLVLDNILSAIYISNKYAHINSGKLHLN